MASPITSESIIKDSLEHQIRLEKPKQSIEDLEELRSLQLTKRREYELQLNKNKLNYGQWIRYARWEIEFNHDFKRARSIYERALLVNVEHVPFWTNYIKFELSHNNINHARNLLDRAVGTLPRVDKFWFLYVQTEETVQNFNKVRQLFKSWIKWNPPAAVWDAYVSFERRYEETENVREVFSNYVLKHPRGETWINWIDFEINVGDVQYIRNVFELSIDNLLKVNPNDKKIPEIIEKWAFWEYKSSENERANEIFRFILDKSKFSFDADQYQRLLQAFTSFESKFGDENNLTENVILKRKLKYVSNVEKNPNDIDSWWLLLDMMYGDELEEWMEKSIANVPKDSEKTILWRRYVFLWIKYCLYLEFSTKDIEKARELWNKSLSITSKDLMFGKLWILYTEFEIRNSDEPINKARKVLGRSIGSMVKPKDKIFKYYVELEKRLGEWDRVRKIYEKWLEVSFTNNRKALKVLLDYVEFEKELQEFNRCEALFSMGLEFIQQDLIADKLTPYDYLYMSFIEYYKEQFEYSKALDLFEKLVDDYDNVKVWITYANFYSTIPTDTQLQEFNASNEQEFTFELGEEQRENTRRIYRRALDHYKSTGESESRLVILEAWRQYEEENGDDESLKSVAAKFPQIVKRMINENNIQTERLEYIFPDDKPTIPNLSKFLQNAKKWAQK